MECLIILLEDSHVVGARKPRTYVLEDMITMYVCKSTGRLNYTEKGKSRYSIADENTSASALAMPAVKLPTDCLS